MNATVMEACCIEAHLLLCCCALDSYAETLINCVMPSPRLENFTTPDSSPKNVDSDFDFGPKIRLHLRL